MEPGGGDVTKADKEAKMAKKFKPIYWNPKQV